MEIVGYTDLKLGLCNVGLMLSIDGVPMCALSYMEAEWIYYMDHGLLPFTFNMPSLYRLVYRDPTLKLV